MTFHSDLPIGLKHGFRSGLEEQIAKQLEAAGVPVSYESMKIRYTQPSSDHTYTPDFPLPNGIIIESKGRFVTEDRQKHLLIRSQYPSLDIRFVFTNPNAKLYKGAKSTYADWCRKNGFLFSKKTIPPEWLTEGSSK